MTPLDVIIIVIGLTVIAGPHIYIVWLCEREVRAIVKDLNDLPGGPRK